MMPLLGFLAVELQKWRRSLAAALVFAAPSLIGLFFFFNILRGNAPRPWDTWLTSACAIWAFFLLPMSVTAICALAAQMEHGPRTWDHLRALPTPRWYLYAAKTACVLLSTAVMSAGVLVATWLAVELAGYVRPAVAATGNPDWTYYIATLARMFLSAILLVAVQLWTALRFTSFVPALALGIAGTFFAVVATASEIGVFLPWQIPINMLATEAWRSSWALGIGAVGGLMAIGAMLAHLGCRDVP